MQTNQIPGYGVYSNQMGYWLCERWNSPGEWYWSRWAKNARVFTSVEDAAAQAGKMQSQDSDDLKLEIFDVDWEYQEQRPDVRTGKMVWVTVNQ